MREVVGRTPPVPRWFWVVPVGQVPMLVGFGQRVVEGERGASVVVLVLGAITAVLGTVTAAGWVPTTRVVLTDDTLRVERPWRPLRVDRSAVVAVDGNVPGRPSWSEAVVVTVREPGAPDRAVRLPRLGTHARVLVPRLREWAGIGDAAPADQTR
ncbi:hypothetical protein EBM89_17690 [Cellulomonas triticagri]|uniref:PH domain-containing protein n=1 Tax=Cellulomonas triticagri TaxID=2483352 RepID=A0A3M2J002_9CELL|nr:hypothetical protein EBM89_17690 [Cellulomonas triticagri]